jgi:dipeptidyl aminopeptidase/acylaminoacyl peptidase
MFDAIRGIMLPLVFGTTDRNSEIVSKASPVTHITSDDPPFLILHGDKDILVPLSQSEVLYDRLVAAQVPATLVVVQNGTHGFSAEGGPMTPTWNEIIDTIAEFFDQHLK